MGKDILKILKRKDVGAIGIGAMIVFIAMVLVAGIAASVLVQTANKLEIQAMTTGEQTTAEVATGLSVVDIEGNIGTADIARMTITVQPRAGSGDIDLSETFLEISDSAIKNILKYDSGSFTDTEDINGNIMTPGFFSSLTGQTFGIIVLEDADGSCTSGTPVINRGDKVMLTVLCDSDKAFNREIPERTDVWGMVQPEDGSAGVFGFRTPASYEGDSVFDLY